MTGRESGRGQKQHFTDSESKADDAIDGTVGGIGEEAYLGTSGSSGAGRKMTNTLTFIGQGVPPCTEHSNYKLRETESCDPIAAVLG